MAVHYLGDNGPDGVCLGTSASELVGFHGATPSAQDVIATLTSGTLGDANTAINAIIDILHAKGLAAAS